MYNQKDLVSLKIRLENKIKQLQQKQEQQTQYYSMMIKKLQQILNSLSQNTSNLNRSQIEALQLQIGDYLGIDSFKKQEILINNKAQKPELTLLLQNQLEALKCVDCGSGISYLYIDNESQFALCGVCSQTKKEKNGYKVEDFMQLYIEFRNKIINLQDIMNSHDDINQFQDRQNQILDQFKIYYISKVSGYQKYVKEMNNFQQLSKNKIDIGRDSVQQLCKEIKVAKEWKLGEHNNLHKIKDASSNYINDGNKLLANLNEPLNICKTNNSQFNSEIVYHNIQKEVQWIEFRNINQNISFYNFIKILNNNQQKVDVEHIEHNQQSIGTSREPKLCHFMPLHFDIWIYENI